MAWTFRLEDHFCPACLNARHGECDGLNWWCTCWCIADDPALDGVELVQRRGALPVQRLPVQLPSEGTAMMSYTLIQGNQAHTSGLNGPITRVVIHATVSPCEVGGARGNARYFQSAGAGGLAHFVVDPKEIVQCCPEDIACWHAPPNKGSIGVELCDPQTGDPSRWMDQDHTRMLHLAAQLVADLCKRHNVPTVFVDGTALRAGAHGITTHHEVVQAWHQSDHTDPGPGFPMGQFIALVHDAAGTSAPTPSEDTVTPQDIEAVAQRVAALLKPVVATHDDIKVLLNGTADGSHPYNLTSIGKTIGVQP